MTTTAIGEELLSELLYNPGIHRQEVMDHMCTAAGIVEDDITHSIARIQDKIGFSAKALMHLLIYFLPCAVRIGRNVP
jgi:hypothetical protein